MNEILDFPEGQQKRSKLFSKLSLTLAVIALFLFGYLFSQISIKVNSDFNFSISTMIAYLIFTITLGGTIMTVLSFVRKEPSSWIKWVGVVLNFIMLVFIFGSIIFAKMMDNNC